MVGLADSQWYTVLQHARQKKDPQQTKKVPKLSSRKSVQAGIELVSPKKIEKIPLTTELAPFGAISGRR
jgi:hypothetical protein